MSPAVAALFNCTFDRDGQLQVIASTLEHLRTNYPEKWNALGAGNRLPEFKRVIKDLVRAADESVDHHATVGFVSQAAADRLEACANSRRRPRALKGDLRDATRFSHEHATPVEVLFRTVTLRENSTAPILEMLQALCCRVLVTKEEQKIIDGAHAWTVPSSLEWGSGVAFGVRTLMPELLPLIRYHEVDRTLALSLIPLSSVRAEQLRRFQGLLSTDLNGLERAYLECKRKPGVSFVLSDDIYRGTARMRQA